MLGETLSGGKRRFPRRSRALVRAIMPLIGCKAASVQLIASNSPGSSAAGISPAAAGRIGLDERQPIAGS